MIRRSGKMTLTFNPEKYKQLLNQYQPKLIRTEAENEQALMVIEDLMHRPLRTPEEDELYDLLSFLVEKFEAEFYQPGSASSPISILQFLMEQRNIKVDEINKILNNELNWDELIEKTIAITPEQAQQLSNFFGVDFRLFLE